MRRSRFTEEQIIGILREQEAGATTADLCRKHGMSEATLYNWMAEYGGIEVSDAKRPKALEDENAKLKKLLAEVMLDASDLGELRAKSGRARRKTRGSRAPAGRLWPVGAAGLYPQQGSPEYQATIRPRAKVGCRHVPKVNRMSGPAV